MQKLTKLSVILLLIISSFVFAACGPEEPTNDGPILVNTITLQTAEVSLLKGDTYTFVASVLPSNAENQAVRYYVQNTLVATVDQTTGILTAVNAGVTNLVAQSLDGSNVFAAAQVHVYNEAIQLTTPTNFILTDGVLSWDAVNNALGYVVYIDNVAQQITSLTEHTIANFNVSHTYSVQAVGDNYTIITSPKTSIITAKLLAVPANFTNVEDTISWSSVTGAESYEVWVNGATINNELNTSLQLDLSTAGEYEIKVRAIIDEVNAYSSKYTESLEIIRLAVPGAVNYQPGGIVWNPVTSAIHYVVSINDVETTTNLSNYQLPIDAEAISYTFKVKAAGNGTNILDSVYSLEFTTTKLETPENVRVQDGKIMWDAVSLAQSYSLLINEEVIQVGQATEYELLDTYLAGLYTIQVMANGNANTYTNSNYSGAISTTKLSASMQVSVVGGVVSWLPVNHATRYVVTLDNTEYITSNTYFIPDETVEAGEYTLTVLAEAENYIYSHPTESIIVEKLGMPQDFRIENGLLRWTSVPHVASYELVAGSNTFNTGVLNGYYLRLPGATSYDVKIRSKGDNTKYLTSEYTATITANKLATPENITLNAGYIDITPVVGASSYLLEINGTPFVMTADMFPYYLGGTPGEIYNLRLLARGNNVQYLNSEYTQVYTANQLAPVLNVNIVNSTINWDAIDGVQMYEVWIKNSEAEDYNKETDVYYSATNSYDLTSIGSGTYSVKVRALGNNLNSLTGVDSEELYFEKLASPTNFRIQYGMLLWNNVSNATQYLLEINGAQEFVGSSLYALDDSYPVGSYTIRIAAYGDGANYITSDWSAEVIQADRMIQPQNIRVVDGAVEWDPVEGATIYVVYVAGIYYVGEGEDLLPRFESDDPYPAGFYDFTVYAASETTLASKKTVLSNVHKIPYPTNLRVENKIIKWDSVLVGTGYELVINTDVVSTTDLSFDFVADYPSYGPGEYSLKVRAMGDMGDGLGNKINSDYCGAVPLTVMAYPNNLSVSNGLISWIPVEGATDYEIRVYEEVSEGVYSLLTIDDPLLTGNVNNFLLGENYEAGNYQIDIRAIGDGSRYITSEFSPTINVTKLEAPTGLGLYNGLIVYDSVVNAQSYEVLANDVFTSAGSITVYELESYFMAGLYDLYVRAVGDDTIYLTSNLSSTIQAEKLAMVEDFRIENGILKWSPVGQASEYVLNVNYQDYYIGLVTSYELPDEFIQGNYQIKIKARGNSVDLLNSSYTEILQAYKMDAITNLRVESGVITWNGVTATDGYTVTIINEALQEAKVTLDYTATSYVLSSDFVNGNYLIYVQTNGNDESNLNSVKIGNAAGTSGFAVTKLQIPDEITLTETDGVYSLSWTQVPLAPNYRIVIVKDNQIAVDAIVASTEAYEVQGLDTGIHYVSVQAIGDNFSLVNSDLRTPITVTQPSTPTNLTIANGVVSWTESAYATEYQLSITYEGVLQPTVTVTDTYYYLSDLGAYEISVRAYYSGSLPSEATEVVEYTFDLFAGGNGTLATPFEVSSAAELNNVKYNPTAYYVLTSDIALPTTNFVPIGTFDKPFIGNFDGNYHTIAYLTINNSYTYSGLFGYIGAMGVVKNFDLTSVNITSPSEYTGSVAGYNEGTILYVTAQGIVQPNLTDASKLLYAGGIAGYNKGSITLVKATLTVRPINDHNLVYGGGISGYNNGLITQSGVETSGSVIANFAGGVTGYNNGNISESYNKGSVTASAKTGADGYAGGIAGYNLNTDTVGGYTGLIINSYNWGSVTSTSSTVDKAYAGGVVGYNRYSSTTSYGEVKYSYNAGLVTASNTYYANYGYAGGVVGWNENATKLSYSYYLNTTATIVTDGTAGTNCGAKTDTEIKSYDFATTFNNLYGSVVWDSVNSSTRAKFVWEASY